MAGRQDDHDDEGGGSFSSPPCFMHEVDPAYMGLDMGGCDKQQRADVMRWRKAERTRLIEQRLAISMAERQAHTEVIARQLDEIAGDVSGKIVSAYWPIRGEPDLRGWLARVAERGGVTALPVVAAKATPLVFRLWRQGEPLEKGVWNIPVPPEGAQEVMPDIVLAPIVGFDRSCYRLGYGGGYFDRTLEAAPKRPMAIGVGYASMELKTIYPQPHDMALDVIVTEREIIERREAEARASAGTGG